MNLQGSKIKASRTKTAWKSAENSQKTAEKSVNLRANFDKNKKASRIKALREFAMKRLTDFFGEKGWKTGKMGYNENRKRSKYGCWTVPMRDWNYFLLFLTALLYQLNRTYEWLKQDNVSEASPKHALHRIYERLTHFIAFFLYRFKFIACYIVPMGDDFLLLNLLFLHEYFECLSS